MIDNIFIIKLHIRDNNQLKTKETKQNKKNKKLLTRDKSFSVLTTTTLNLKNKNWLLKYDLFKKKKKIKYLEEYKKVGVRN